jgi:hypothetical protein
LILKLIKGVTLGTLNIMNNISLLNGLIFISIFYLVHKTVKHTNVIPF